MDYSLQPKNIEWLNGLKKRPNDVLPIGDSLKH